MTLILLLNSSSPRPRPLTSTGLTLVAGCMAEDAFSSDPLHSLLWKQVSPPPLPTVLISSYFSYSRETEFRVATVEGEEPSCPPHLDPGMSGPGIVSQQLGTCVTCHVSAYTRVLGNECFLYPPCTRIHPCAYSLCLRAQASPSGVS